MTIRKRARLFLSTPEEFQVWYREQDSNWLIINADKKEFKDLVRMSYTWKVSTIRFCYKIKRFLLSFTETERNTI